MSLSRAEKSLITKALLKRLENFSDWGTDRWCKITNGPITINPAGTLYINGDIVEVSWWCRYRLKRWYKKVKKYQHSVECDKQLHRVRKALDLIPEARPEVQQIMQVIQPGHWME